MRHVPWRREAALPSRHGASSQQRRRDFFHARLVGDSIGGHPVHGVDTPRAPARKQPPMTTRVDKHQWEVHAAYRLGWEVRISYYQRLVRGIRAMLVETQNLMKVDDMDDAIRWT